MAKGKGPNKGFLRELEKGGTKAPGQKRFDYKKAITPESRQTENMHTPHRLREFKSVAPSRGLVVETQMHIKKRRGD